MNEWNVLEIEETADITIIKKAYSSLIKKYKPHTHPENFKKIRAAYEKVIEAIECGITSDSDNNENSIFQSEGQDNDKLADIASNSSTGLSEKIQHHEIKKFYIEHIIELYTNLETRNNVEIWQADIQRNSTELLMDDRSFDLILMHIISSEYLYQSDLPFEPEMYILLFDFFNVDETFFISNNYSKYVSRPLLSMLSQHRYDLRLASIQESDFNLNFPTVQIAAEDYYSNLIINSADLIAGNIEKLSEHLRNSTLTYVIVLGNVVFKDILDKYICNITQQDHRLVGRFYNLFKFKNNKKLFFKIFTQMGYNKEDIKNCLNFAKEMYIRYVQPSFWSRIIKIKPLLAFIFGLILVLVYTLMKDEPKEVRPGLGDPETFLPKFYYSNRTSSYRNQGVKD